MLNLIVHSEHLHEVRIRTCIHRLLGLTFYGSHVPTNLCSYL